MTRYLIFGSHGFVGFNLKIELERYGHVVETFDRRDTENSQDIISNLQEVEKAVERNDIVYHLAAKPAHRLSIDNPVEIIRNNYLATLYIVEACRKHKKKLIYASSFSVYGNQPTPWGENTPLESTTPYGHAKVACEDLLKLYHTLYGLDIMIARFSNVFGPFEELHEPNQVLPIWFNKVNEGKDLIVYGEDTTRDFTYVWDVCMGLMQLSRLDGFQIFNICSGEELFLLDVAGFISNNVVVKPLPSYETRKWVGDNTKLKSLGWAPTKKVYDWILELRKGGKI